MSATSLRGLKPALRPDAEALTKAPPAPFWLSTHAKAEWKRIMPQLIARRIITRADLAGVEAYCSAAGICRQLEEERRAAGGMIDKTAFGIWNRAAQTARQLASEYGLTPTSRARIGSAEPEDADADDPLAV
ncbi:phage terminase small subunit P27 family [Phaeovulum vinaykumarii]|uniref:Phage terminase, small subunit, putative, P27 family n=1 Tax=Phaeovulum vinaykumarii TaxID=407234 RepID=A0A1N7K6J0_9RHOB|nr:phage terminase small subunit P27 family [Phaeovulum vinaykumarii]SIS57180.1 phage terminase, small subunit, putative, P27 family [Phaeovulum vinaykumarii]SOB93305.1 P27 family predicted phage terminase small subunit [Phaeovulum vinaykumarii]